MPLVLVNRPEPGASRTAEALAGRGIAAVVAPLFQVTFTGVPAPDGPFDALIVSSANGADGLDPASVPLAPDAMVFAVGERTAAALSEAGFSEVLSADGDQRDLARLVIAALPAARKLLYATGEEHKPGLPAALTKAGHTVALWVRYRAEAASSLPDAARGGLRDGAISHVLHYSRRGSETFVALADAAGVSETARACTHLCLSEDAAEPLRAAGYGAAEAGDVIVAPRPDESSLLESLDASLSIAPTSAAMSDSPGEPVTPSLEAPAPDASAPSSAPDTPSARITPASSGAKADARGEARADAPASTGTARGGLAGLLAGLVGGFVVAGLMLWQGPSILQTLGLRSPAPDPVAPLLTRLSALESARTDAGRAASAEITRVAGELRGEIQRLQAELARLAARPAAGGGEAALSDDVRGRLEALQRAQEALTARLQALEPRVQATERAASSAAGQGPAENGKAQAAARLVLSDRVARALDEGRDFAAEAKALAALGAPSELATRLGGATSVEVPSRQSLAAVFRDVRPSLLVETAGAPEPSLVDRLLRLTDGLVRVRATGSIEGASPAALTARIDQALQRGDIAAAQAAFAQLPEPARRAGAAFEALMQRRGQMEAALKAIQDEAVTALAAP